MSAGTKAILVAVAGLLGGVILAVAIVLLASSGDVEVKLGDDEFEAGRTSELADDIADQGQPLIFQDLAGGDRHIWVQHLGTDEEQGWFAFDIRVPDEEDCLTEWDGDAEVFVSTCDDSVTFPPDGEGLRQYDTRVEDERLVVDLRS